MEYKSKRWNLKLKGRALRTEGYNFSKEWNFAESIGNEGITRTQNGSGRSRMRKEKNGSKRTEGEGTG
jgi:hypothetical protein